MLSMLSILYAAFDVPFATHLCTCALYAPMPSMPYAPADAYKYKIKT
jgi:hypothetical protein